MTAKKSIFESHELSSSLSLETENDREYGEELKPTGQERRKEVRRKSKDRREEVRFEINKTDRRETQGRRQDDKLPSFY